MRRLQSGYEWQLQVTVVADSYSTLVRSDIALKDPFQAKANISIFNQLIQESCSIAHSCSWSGRDVMNWWTWWRRCRRRSSRPFGVKHPQKLVQETVEVRNDEVTVYLIQKYRQSWWITPCCETQQERISWLTIRRIISLIFGLQTIKHTCCKRCDCVAVGSLRTAVRGRNCWLLWISLRRFRDAFRNPQ